MMRISSLIFFATLSLACVSFCSQKTSTEQAKESFTTQETQQQLQILAEAHNAMIESTNHLRDYIALRNQEAQAAQLVKQAQATAQEIKNSLTELSW
jgi:PBP1b-binding outer membrane lipoprotein LpoB